MAPYRRVLRGRIEGRLALSSPLKKSADHRGRHSCERGNPVLSRLSGPPLSRGDEGRPLFNGLLCLRIKDIEFDRNEIVVREGKGNKDRVTMLPSAVKEPLRAHLAQVRHLQERDLQAALAGCSCPTH